MVDVTLCSSCSYNASDYTRLPSGRLTGHQLGHTRRQLFSPLPSHLSLSSTSSYYHPLRPPAPSPPPLLKVYRRISFQELVCFDGSLVERTSLPSELANATMSKPTLNYPCFSQKYHRQAFVLSLLLRANNSIEIYTEKSNKNANYNGLIA